MPLVRSLTAALGWRGYRHGAPSGALLLGTCSTENSEEPSFPWDVMIPRLAIPQLLWSSAWAILLLIMRGSLTVFLHRGLSPDLFRPMSGAHRPVERMAAEERCVHIRAAIGLRHRSLDRWPR